MFQGKDVQTPAGTYGLVGGLGWHHKGMRREQGLRGAPGCVDEAGWTDSGCMFTNKQFTEWTK